MTAPLPTPNAPGRFALWFPRVLVALLALYFARGILPFAPFEGDEQGVINGVQAWMRGSGDFASASYLYPIQPGSYHLLAWLQRFTGAAPLAIFGTLSALGAAAFITCASLLLARIAAVRAAWVAVLLLTLQEFTTAAAYANTNALAAGFALAGLLVAQRARGRTALLGAGLLLGLGGWLRLDSLLISPAFLFVRLTADKPARAIADTALAAAVSALVLVVACAATGVFFAAIAATFSSRNAMSTSWQRLWFNGWLVLGFVPTLLCGFGVIRLLLLRHWLLLGLVAGGTALSVIVYGPNFTSPKYFYYAAPFLVLPGLLWLAEALGNPRPGWNPARLAAVAVLGLHVAEITLGVQSSGPLFRRFDAAAPVLALGSVSLRGKMVRVGFGEGEIIPTDDGPRLRNGQAWAPGRWRWEKRAMLEEVDRLDAVMQAGGADVIVTSTYLSVRVLESWLRAHGFAAQSRRPFPHNPSSYLEEWASSGRHLTVAQINDTNDDVQEFAASVRLPGHVLVVNDRGGNAFRYLSAGTGEWQSLSPAENRLLTLYRPQKDAAAPRLP